MNKYVGGQAAIELLYSPHGPGNFCYIREKTQLFGLNLFMHLAFQQETIWYRHIGNIDTLACVTFNHVDISGYFVCVDILN